MSEVPSFSEGTCLKCGDSRSDLREGALCGMCLRYFASQRKRVENLRSHGRRIKMEIESDGCQVCEKGTVDHILTGICSECYGGGSWSEN